MKHLLLQTGRGACLLFISLYSPGKDGITTSPGRRKSKGDADRRRDGFGGNNRRSPLGNGCGAKQLPPKLASAKGWVPGQATRRADEPLLVKQDGAVPAERKTDSCTKEDPGNRWGWHAKPVIYAASGADRTPSRCLHGGVADLPSECPFGAERGTERTALRQTFCGASCRRCGERPNHPGCAGHEG